MTDEQRKALVERLRREAMLKRMKERAARSDEKDQPPSLEPEHEIPANVMQKRAEEREGDISFAERLRQRLFEPYPAFKKNK